MKKTVILIMVLTIVTNIISFLKEIIFSYYFGASNITDAYLISLTIPSVIFGFVGMGISTGYIPIYTNIEKHENLRQANRFTNNLINIMIGLCSLLAVIGIIFATPLVQVFASGFSGETLTLAVKFTRIGFLGIYFTAIVAVLNSYLQIKGNFAIPSIGTLPVTLVTILAIIISSKGNITILAIGTVVGGATQLLFLMPFVYKKGFRYQPNLDLKDPHIERMVMIALPLILGVAADQINVLADRTVASQIAVGGITVLSYANKLILFIQTIFIYSITTAIYPMISKLAAENNILKLKKVIVEVISAVCLLIVPATIGIMILSEPIVKLLYGRGEFDTKALAMTSGALFFYAIGLTGIGIRDILARTFFSLQDTKTPAIIALVSVATNVFLNLTLSRFMGISGLALATGIAETVGMLLLFGALRKKVGPLGIKGLLISFFKILIASLIMGGITKGIFIYLNIYLGLTVSLFVSILVAIIIYLVLILILKIDEVKGVFDIIREKFIK